MHPRRSCLSLLVIATDSHLMPVPPSHSRTGGPPLHRQPLHKLRPLLRHYWHRMAGVSLSWFVWDLAFFGNKLFQGSFIKVVSSPNRQLCLREFKARSMRSFVWDCAFYGNSLF